MNIFHLVSGDFFWEKNKNDTFQNLKSLVSPIESLKTLSLVWGYTLFWTGKAKKHCLFTDFIEGTKDFKFLNLELLSLSPKLVNEKSFLVIQTSFLVTQNSFLVIQNSYLVIQNSFLVTQNSNLVSENLKLVNENSNLVNENSDLVSQFYFWLTKNSNFVKQCLFLIY